MRLTLPAVPASIRRVFPKWAEKLFEDVRRLAPRWSTRATMERHERGHIVMQFVVDDSHSTTHRRVYVVCADGVVRKFGYVPFGASDHVAMERDESVPPRVLDSFGLAAWIRVEHIPAFVADCRRYEPLHELARVVELAAKVEGCRGVCFNGPTTVQDPWLGHQKAAQIDSGVTLTGERVVEPYARPRDDVGEQIVTSRDNCTTHSLDESSSEAIIYLMTTAAMTAEATKALESIKGYASANRIVFGSHARLRMSQRGATPADVRHALVNGSFCRASTDGQGRWLVDGKDLDRDDLTVCCVIEDGVVVVTVY